MDAGAALDSHATSSANDASTAVAKAEATRSGSARSSVPSLPPRTIQHCASGAIRFDSDAQRIVNTCSAVDANVRAQVPPPTRVDSAQCSPGRGPADPARTARGRPHLASETSVGWVSGDPFRVGPMNASPEAFPHPSGRGRTTTSASLPIHPGLTPWVPLDRVCPSPRRCVRLSRVPAVRRRSLDARGQSTPTPVTLLTEGIHTFLRPFAIVGVEGLMTSSVIFLLFCHSTGVARTPSLG